MENIITLNAQNTTLSDEEIETLFKGFIKLVEKNTEQKIKNSMQKNMHCEQNKTNENMPKLNVKTIKDLEDLKQTALRIFEENKRLKLSLKQLEGKVLELRSLLVNNDIKTN